jgi:hypothetical protein
MFASFSEFQACVYLKQSRTRFARKPSERLSISMLDPRPTH